MRSHSALLVVFAVVMAACLLVPSNIAQAATAAELAAQVKALNAEVSDAGAAYDAAFWRQYDTEKRLDRLEAVLAETESELSDAELHLSTRATSMYRRADDDVVTFLLGSTSFQEMATRAFLWERIAVEDARIVSHTLKLRDEYEVEISMVERERERITTETDALRRQKESLEAQLASKQKEYDRLQAALEAAIAAEAAANNVTYQPPSSANGMTFPVAGPHYYSDTWGAARSGGRSHKGTDIMASHGIPLVAVLPGTVIAKSGGLGGKTIWLTADNGWKFYYAHMDSWSVTSGRVEQGQVIGTVGSTGNASYTAPHLHFEIHPNGGAAVNPYPYLRAMQGY